VALILHPFIAVADDVVTFLDPKLEAVIRETIGKPTGDIYQSDPVGLNNLPVYHRGITDLTGMEYCTNLITLDLKDNQITSISPLAEQPNRK